VHTPDSLAPSLGLLPPELPRANLDNCAVPSAASQTRPGRLPAGQCTASAHHGGGGSE
jgi:hypothetical protein